MGIHEKEQRSANPSGSTEGTGMSPPQTQYGKNSESIPLGLPKSAKRPEEKTIKIKKFRPSHEIADSMKPREIGDSSDHLDPRQDLESETPALEKEDAKQIISATNGLESPEERIKKKVSAERKSLVMKVIGWIVAGILASMSLFAVFIVSINAEGPKSETWPWGGWYLFGVVVDIFCIELHKNSFYFLFFRWMVLSPNPKSWLKFVVSYTTGDDITHVLTAKKNIYETQQKAESEEKS